MFWTLIDFKHNCSSSMYNSDGVLKPHSRCARASFRECSSLVITPRVPFVAWIHPCSRSCTDLNMLFNLRLLFFRMAVVNTRNLICSSVPRLNTVSAPLAVAFPQGGVWNYNRWGPYISCAVTTNQYIEHIVLNIGWTQYALILQVCSYS